MILVVGAVFTAIEPAGFDGDASAGAIVLPGMGESGEDTSPGDIAMAGGVKVVMAFVEKPVRAGVNFAESK